MVINDSNPNVSPKEPNNPNHQQQRWTASDRAQHVVQDDKLHALLTAEIEKSGFLTSAGHRTVLQKFLYSDAVEKEIVATTNACNNKSRTPSQLGRRFRRLMSDIAPTSTCSDTNSTSSSSRGLTPPVVVAQKRTSSSSSSSVMSTIRRFSMGSIDALAAATTELAADNDDDNEDEEDDYDDDSVIHRNGNLAPQRQRSQRNIQASDDYTIDTSDHSSTEGEVSLKNLFGFEADEDDLQDDATSRWNETTKTDNIAPRRLSQGGLQVIYTLENTDNTEADHSTLECQVSLKNLLGCKTDADDLQDTTTRRINGTMREETAHVQQSEKSSYAYMNSSADNLLKSLQGDTSEWLPWPNQLEEDEDDDDDHGKEYSNRPSSPDSEDNCSDTYESGWLPWPKRRDDDCCGDDDTNGR